MPDLDSAAAATKPYSDIEEDFFRAGDEMSAGLVEDPVEFDAPQRKNLLTRLFDGLERLLRLRIEPDFVPAPARVRAATERPI